MPAMQSPSKSLESITEVGLEVGITPEHLFGNDLRKPRAAGGIRLSHLLVDGTQKLGFGGSATAADLLKVRHLGHVDPALTD
jgi:hypothetical protein